MGFTPSAISIHLAAKLRKNLVQSKLRPQYGKSTTNSVAKEPTFIQLALSGHSYHPSNPELSICWFSLRNITASERDANASAQDRGKVEGVE
jgi:hypothetical protein